MTVLVFYQKNVCPMNKDITQRRKDNAKKNYKKILRSLSVSAPWRAAFLFLVPARPG
jgi:hypothetical protein